MIVTWQPVLTDHQAYTYLALQEASGLPVVSFVTSKEDSIRKAQGWTDTRVTVLERRFLPERGWLAEAKRWLQQSEGAVHIFASPFQQPKLMLVLLMAALFRARFYLISEPYSPIGAGYYSARAGGVAALKAALRPLLYRLYMSLLRGRVNGIFAISRLAQQQYQAAGVPDSKIMPFGYFVPTEPLSDQSARQRGAPHSPRFVFVASLIHRKGIDLLVSAMHDLHQQGVLCEIDFYGPGDPACLEGVPGARYRGIIAFGEAQSVIAGYDLLVLPSRHDGWGVVVNEAVCAGVPVLCSDSTGAGHVVAGLGAARLFVSNDSASLASELARLLSSPALLAQLRTAAPQAAERLQPGVAAQYMWRHISAAGGLQRHVAPPWQTEAG